MAIPKNALNYDMIYEEYDITNDAGETYNSPITIKNVDFQISSIVNKSTNYEEGSSKSAIIFVDAKNSLIDGLSIGETIYFKEKSKVTISKFGHTETYYIKNSQPQSPPKSKGNLHHWELEVE